MSTKAFPQPHRLPGTNPPYLALTLGAESEVVVVVLGDVETLLPLRPSSARDPLKMVILLQPAPKCDVLINAVLASACDV